MAALRVYNVPQLTSVPLYQKSKTSRAGLPRTTQGLPRTRRSRAPSSHVGSHDRVHNRPVMIAKSSTSRPRLQTSLSGKRLDGPGCKTDCAGDGKWGFWTRYLTKLAEEKARELLSVGCLM